MITTSAAYSSECVEDAFSEVRTKFRRTASCLWWKGLTRLRREEGASRDAHLRRLDELDRLRGENCKGYRAPRRTSQRTRPEVWSDNQAGLLDRRPPRPGRNNRSPQRRERQCNVARTWLCGEPQDLDASRLRQRRDVEHHREAWSRIRCMRTRRRPLGGPGPPLSGPSSYPYSRTS